MNLKKKHQSSLRLGEPELRSRLRLFALSLVLASAIVASALAFPASWAPLLAAGKAPQDYQGPLPAIASGYGSWGDHGVSEPASFEIESHGQTNRVTLYFPDGLASQAPPIFFAPGWDVSCESYGELLRFLASKGYVSVCDDYHEDEDVSDIGGQLYDSFKEAVSRYPTRIDVSKFGLIGHSSGAGLLPSVGYKLAVDDGWGVQGKFIFSSAPWIDFDITDEMLDNYPTDMKFILQTYEDDMSTDLRTYIDQFESQTRIPDSEKDYVTLRPATIDGHDYLADHAAIATGGDGYGVYDAMDTYGIFRLIDALADYAFTGHATAKSIALEENYNSDKQSEMGDLPDLISTDDPRPIPGQVTEYPCDISDNPRKEYCDDYDNELPAAVQLLPIRRAMLSQASPTFRWEAVPTAINYSLQVRPMLDSGEPDWDTSYGENVTATAAGCDEEGQECVYTLTATLPNDQYVWWIKGYDVNGKESVWTRRAFFEKVANTANTLYLPIIQMLPQSNAVQYPPNTLYKSIFTETPAMPDYLATIEDTTTSTLIKRITQLDSEHYGSYYPTHSYSKNQPWNADATLYKFYSVAVYDAGTHQIVRVLPSNLYESFWSNTNPDLIYSFLEDGTIKTYSVSSGEETILAKLNGYDLVKLGPGEGNIDIHDKYVALVGKKNSDLEVIVFDLQENVIVTTKNFPGAWGASDSIAEHIDWVSVSQSGDYVVINWDTGTPSDMHPFDGHYGIEVYNTTDMTFLRRPSRYGNHGDLCFAPDGDELYVQFWGDYGTINAYHLDDGQNDIIHTHSDFGVGEPHLSCRNILRPGWAYVSVDHTKGGMVIAVKLDGSETIEYFGHHFSSTTSYEKSPMPVPSPNGTVVMFKSDFGDDSNPKEAYAFEARYAGIQSSARTMWPNIIHHEGAK